MSRLLAILCSSGVAAGLVGAVMIADTDIGHPAIGKKYSVESAGLAEVSARSRVFGSVDAAISSTATDFQRSMSTTACPL